MSYTLTDSFLDFQEHDKHDCEDLTFEQILLVLKWLGMEDNPRTHYVRSYVRGEYRERG